MAKVIRKNHKGVQQIRARELVPGDLVDVSGQYRSSLSSSKHLLWPSARARRTNPGPKSLRRVTFKVAGALPYVCVHAAVIAIPRYAQYIKYADVRCLMVARVSAGLWLDHRPQHDTAKLGN